jgi:hypothetical protein
MMAMIDKKLTKNSKFWLPWIRIAPVLCASFFFELCLCRGDDSRR